MTAPDRCSEPVQGARRCMRAASTVIDGWPVCGQHAAIAARRAAEAAEEAAYWEKKFAPRPGQPWRTDPEWQAAKRDALTDLPDENDNDALIRRMNGIYRVHAIEARYKALASAAPCARASSTRR